MSPAPTSSPSELSARLCASCGGTSRSRANEGGGWGPPAPPALLLLEGLPGCAVAPFRRSTSCLNRFSSSSLWPPALPVRAAAGGFGGVR